MIHMRRKFRTIVTFLLLGLRWADGFAGEPSQANCFSILVGREVSQSGAVLFAHNEDDWGRQLVNWYYVPRRTHASGETVILKSGAELPQVSETWGYHWWELPGMNFADSYLNEWGVTIASNACRSREDSTDLTEGGITYWLRRLMAERARTAREAVLIGGALVEKYGYDSSGRTYCIADPQEAWLMAVVRGRHWVAQRVPDDGVVVMPNYYVIERVDLQDSTRFLGCPDLIEYAIDQGWYEKGTEFSFREVYGSPQAAVDMDNRGRHWRSLELLLEDTLDINREFPFALKPAGKVAKTDLMQVLRDHYEGSAWEWRPNPHANDTMTICSDANQYAFVAELRSWLPAEIGAVLWYAPRKPCIQPFVPIYAGLPAVPQGFAYTDAASAIRHHFALPENIYQPTDTLAYWSFDARVRAVEADWPETFPKARKRSQRFERVWLKKHRPIDAKIQALYRRDPQIAREVMLVYTRKLCRRLRKMNR